MMGQEPGTHGSNMEFLKKKILEIVDDFEKKVTHQVMNDPAFEDKTQKEVKLKIQHLVWEKFGK